MSTLDS